LLAGHFPSAAFFVVAVFVAWYGDEAVVFEFLYGEV